jgi:hypothetical protein
MFSPLIFISALANGIPLKSIARPSPSLPVSPPSYYSPFSSKLSFIFYRDTEEITEKLVENVKSFLESLPSSSRVKTAFLQVLGKGLSAREFAEALSLNVNTVRKAFNKDSIEIGDLFRALVSLSFLSTPFASFSFQPRHFFIFAFRASLATRCLKKTRFFSNHSPPWLLSAVVMTTALTLVELGPCTSVID